MLILGQRARCRGRAVLDFPLIRPIHLRKPVYLLGFSRTRELALAVYPGGCMLLGKGGPSAMNFPKLASTALLLFLVVHPGYAAELIPIEMTAISMTMTVKGVNSSLDETDTGTTDAIVPWTESAVFDGSGTSSVSLVDGRLIFHFDGAVTTTNPSPIGAQSFTSHSIEFDVPNLDDATTTVFMRVTTESSNQVGLQRPVNLTTILSPGGVYTYESTILGEKVVGDFDRIASPPTEETVGQISSGTFIPGDRIRLTFSSQHRVTVDGPGSGSWDETMSVDFFAVQPIPEPTQCSDGIDNDADGRIDLDDKQCKSAEQQSESDPKL